MRPVVVAAVAVVVLAAVSVAAVTWWTREQYAVTCLAVGAHIRDAGADADDPTGTAAFRSDRGRLGPLTVRRSFDSSVPTSFDESSAAQDAGAELHSFVSWKPPGGDFVGAAEGAYDQQVRTWAESVPTTGVYATAFHEPENDMTAVQFVAMQRHLYGVVKKANPTIRWGPVYMAYWWDPSAPGHYVGDPAAWWPGADAADFTALDWYGPRPTPMTQTAAFSTWHTFMLTTDEPMLVTEYGQYVVGAGEEADPAQQLARAAAIRADARWIAEHPEIRMWIYWNGTGKQGDWRLTDRASQAAWSDVARSGCRG